MGYTVRALKVVGGTLLAKATWATTPLFLHDEEAMLSYPNAFQTRVYNFMTDTTGNRQDSPFFTLRRVSRGIDRFTRDVLTAGLMYWEYSPYIRSKAEDWSDAHRKAAARLCTLFKARDLLIVCLYCSYYFY